jgi:hypothetical protein
MPKRLSRPRDINQLAKFIVDQSTGNAPPAPPESAKNPVAVALGKLGGPKGGRARAKARSAKRRKAIARNAAKKRRTTGHNLLLTACNFAAYRSHREKGGIAV